jgi:hypothetical protein
VSPAAIKAAIIDERVNLSMVFSFSLTREAVLGCHLNKGGMLGSNVARLVERTQRRVLAPAKSQGGDAWRFSAGGDQAAADLKRSKVG